MKKYNVSKIMKRAWEIKKEEDRKALNKLYNRNEFRELKENEKVLFSECMKLAWDEAKKAVIISEKYDVSYNEAMIIAEKDSELTSEFGGNVKWNIWRKYGRNRAYYTVSTRSNYANNKKNNYVEL